MQVAGASSDRDSPRAAFALLSWRVNLAVVVALFALSAVCSVSEPMMRSAASLSSVWLAFSEMPAS